MTNVGAGNKLIFHLKQAHEWGARITCRRYTEAGESMVQLSSLPGIAAVTQAEQWFRSFVAWWAEPNTNSETLVPIRFTLLLIDSRQIP